MSPNEPTGEQIEAAAWAIHKHYCMLPGVCTTPDEVDRAAARAALKAAASEHPRTCLVTQLEQTCWACPSQWEGLTEDGDRVYIRYRYGHLRVDIDGHGGPAFALDHGDELDGVMSTEEMQRLTPFLGWAANLLLDR